MQIVCMSLLQSIYSCKGEVILQLGSSLIAILEMMWPRNLLLDEKNKDLDDFA